MVNDFNVSRRSFVGGATIAGAASVVASASKAGSSIAGVGGGRPPVIDFRVRPPFKSFRKMVPPAFLGMSERTTEQDEMARFLAMKKRAGIDISVAIGRTAPAPGKIQLTVPNEEVAELVQRYPKDFVGIGSVDVRDPQKARAEVDRCVALGLKGVAFDNPLLKLYNDDPSLLPIYERCVENKLIIAINSSVMIGSDISYTRPDSIQRLAKRFPEHPVVVTHSSWPFADELISIIMMGLVLGESNIYYTLDYASVSNIPGSKAYLDALNIETGGIPLPVYKKALYTSSFPFLVPMEASIKAIRDFKYIEDKRRDHVLGLNAAKLLGMKLSIQA